MKTKSLFPLGLLILQCAVCFSVHAQVTAFTYQGRLNDGPNPGSGVYDLRFGLWNSPDTNNSTQLGVVTNTATPVANGLFTVTLDFGGPVWTGGARWLELAVRTNGAVSFNTLGPRQAVTPTPYAIYADSVPATGLRGFLQGDKIASGSIGAIQMSNSYSLWNRSANNIFYTNGNVGIGVTNPAAGIHVLGSGFFGDDKDSLPASAGVGVRIFRDTLSGLGHVFAYNYATSSATNLILQEPGGNVGVGITAPTTKLHVAGPVTASSFIGDGSGLTGLSAWKISGNSGTTPDTHFLGTTDNQPLEFRVNNLIGLRLQFAQDIIGQTAVNVIGGSSANIITNALGATIAGGGYFNSPNRAMSGSATVGGGSGNTAAGSGSTISGGQSNSADGSASTVAGGRLNTASGDFSIVSGGFGNTAAGMYSFAAGHRSKANHLGAFVWADSTDADFASTVARQFNVRASGGARFETGGGGLTVDGSAVLTSAANVALRNGGNNFTGNQSISGGYVGIGTSSPTSPLTVHSTSPNTGLEHTDGSTRLATFIQSGSGLFGTFSPHRLDLVANTTIMMTVNTNGNVGIGTTTPTTTLHVAGEITTTAVNITSDRNAKEQFKPVNAREVLAKVVGLPISEWQYKTAGDARHIGPMAQDFREAFALGRDDKHITSVDADGVALAAIQGLNEKLEEQVRDKDRRIMELERSMAELKALVQRVAVAGREGVAE